MLVVAGPPGSGKTTYFPVSSFGVDSFNIDDRCAQVLGSYRAISREVRRAVAGECERFVREHIASSRSFAVETTLRTNAAIEQAELARDSGFLAALSFVATDAIEENVRRVMQRAQSGGHAASERDIRAIHDASVAHLGKALATFHHARVYDSTAPWAPPRLVATASGGAITMLGATPDWLRRALSHDS